MMMDRIHQRRTICVNDQHVEQYSNMINQKGKTVSIKMIDEFVGNDGM